MKCLRALACLAAVFGTATGAWAQYGLSGGPELLRLGPELNDPGLRPANPIRAATGYQMPSDLGYSDRLVGSWEPTAAPGPSVPPPPNPGARRRHPGASAQRDEPNARGVRLRRADAGLCRGRIRLRSRATVRGAVRALFPAQWYVSAAGLFMTRDKANCLWTTYETDNNPNQLMRFNDAKRRLARRLRGEDRPPLRRLRSMGHRGGLLADRRVQRVSPARSIPIGR